MSGLRRRHRAPHGDGPRLGFFGVLGSGNLGNDVSVDTLITHLRARRPDVDLDFLVMGPEKMQARYGAPATPLQWYEAHAGRLSAVPSAVLKIVGRLLDPVRTLRWVRGHDVVIVPGMGVLETTVPTRPWGFPYGLLALCVAARATGTAVMLVSVGADVIDHRLIRWMTTSAAGMASYRSYRDETSKRAMASMGVDVSRDGVHPDLAFARPIPATAVAGARTVGLGVMRYVGNNDERARAAELHLAYTATMKRFAGWLVDTGHPVRLHTCDPEDADVVSEIIDDVLAGRPGLDPDLIRAEPAADLDELQHRMAGLEAVVATRYHNVIAAVQIAVPTISVGYARKHTDLMERMGLADFCQDARAVDHDRLVEQFRALEERRDELVATLTQRSREHGDGARRLLAEVSEVVFGTPDAARAPEGRAPRRTCL